MHPEVSVVIPTHNRRAMVVEAVESVLAQTFRDFELIIVDDGSTDGTYEHLARILDGRGDAAPTVRIERTANRGPAAARNRGISLARGSRVAFLDSDDLWSPLKLQRHLAYARSHPEFPICQTAEIWIRCGRRVNPGRRHLKRAGDIFMDSLRTCLISPSAVMIDRQILVETGGFDEDMVAAEDYDLWLRILALHESGLLDEPLVTRRAGHRDQLSSSVEALDRFRILALAKLRGMSTLERERREAAAAVLAEKCAIYAKGLRRRQRMEDARFHEYLALCARSRWRDAPDSSLTRAVESLRARIRERQHNRTPGRSLTYDCA